MDQNKQVYEVHSADSDGSPGPFEAAYDTVIEVLAHCQPSKSYAIKVEGEFLSLDNFMETHVSAG